MGRTSAPRPTSGTDAVAAAVTGIVFDCDGTLIDSVPLWKTMENGLARRAGITIDDDLAAKLDASTLGEIIRLFHNTYGVGESEIALLAEVMDFLRAGYRCIAPVKPGVIEFVNEAERRNVRMGVVSSSPKELLIDALEHAGLLEHMAAVISVGDMGTTKRDSRPIKAMRRFLGTLKSQTWCFDDSAYALDIFASQGYHTVGVYDSDIAGAREELAEHADAVVDDFTSFDYAVFFAGEGIRPVAKVGPIA
jgi:beta-phosphoglucomutase-like phosphatase (HAD superfamily)